MGIYRAWLFGNPPQVSSEEAARCTQANGWSIPWTGQSSTGCSTNTDTQSCLQWHQEWHTNPWVSLPRGNINSHMNTWTGLQCLIGTVWCVYLSTQRQSFLTTSSTSWNWKSSWTHRRRSGTSHKGPSMPQSSSHFLLSASAAFVSHRRSENTLGATALCNENAERAVST